MFYFTKYKHVTSLAMKNTKIDPSLAKTLKNKNTRTKTHKEKKKYFIYFSGG